MKKVTNLNWPGRLAVLNQFNPSDSDACKVLGISNDELKTARDLEKCGTLVADSGLDTEAYAPLFTPGASVINPKARPSLESVVRDSSKGQPPMSATKKVTAPKKRGRKGDAIAKAFMQVPGVPTPVEAFAQTNGVSLAVMRQSKRFDQSGLPGGVRVKKDKTTGTLMIWRETETTS